jgi:hypothetical protein
MAALTRQQADPGASDHAAGKPGLATAALAGAVGGLYGAAAMSVLRLALHRAGVIDKMVPQVVEEWISDRLNTDPPGGQAGHHVADQLLHLGYGASLGALGGPMLSGRAARGGLWRGAAFGLASWAFGMLVLVPALRVARPAWRTGPLENGTNLAAHLVFGWAIQLLVEEPARQTRGRTSDAERMGRRVG